MSNEILENTITQEFHGVDFSSSVVEITTEQSNSENNANGDTAINDDNIGF